MEANDVFQKRNEHYKAFCDLVGEIERRVANETSDSAQLIDDLADTHSDVENNPPKTNNKKKAIPKDLSACRCRKTEQIVNRVEGELQSDLRNILRNLWKNVDNRLENYDELAMQEMERLSTYMTIIEIQHYIVYVVNALKRENQ